MLNSHSLIYTGHTLITAFRKLKCLSSLNILNDKDDDDYNYNKYNNNNNYYYYYYY